MFFVFGFIFINLFYSGTLRKPSTISELQNTNSKWRFGAWFIFLFSLLTFLFFVCFLFFLFQNFARKNRLTNEYNRIQANMSEI